MRSFCRPRKQWHYMESAKKSYPFTGDVWIGQFDIRDERHATNMHPSTPLCLHYIMLSAIRQVCHSKGPGTIAVWDKKTIRCTFGMGRLVPRRVNHWFLRPFWCLDQTLLPLILGSLTEKLTQCLQPILLGRTHERSARSERSSCNCKGVQQKYEQHVRKSVQTPNSQLIPGLFSPLRRVLKLLWTRPFSLHKKHVETTHLLLRTFQDQGGCTWQNQGGLYVVPPPSNRGKWRFIDVYRDPLLKME